jgi:protease I
MARELEGQRIAFLVANEGIEQVELTEPWKAVVDAGAEAHLIAPKPGEAQAFNHLDKADTFPVNRTTSEVHVEEYDSLVLPGGVANADELRMDTPAVTFTRAFFDTGKRGGHLSCAVGTGRGRCRARSDSDVVAEPSDRHPQRRRHLG